MSDKPPSLSEQIKATRESLDRLLAALIELRRMMELKNQVEHAPMYIMGMFGPKLVK